MITIFINGQPRSVALATNLVDLLAMLEMTGKRIAVELNQEIISRSTFATVFVQEGDHIEIVQAIGGG